MLISVLISAYDEKLWAKSVAGSVRYRLWRVIDARLEGIQLVRKRRRQKSDLERVN